LFFFFYPLDPISAPTGHGNFNLRLRGKWWSMYASQMPGFERTPVAKALQERAASSMRTIPIPTTNDARKRSANERNKKGFSHRFAVGAYTGTRRGVRLRVLFRGLWTRIAKAAPKPRLFWSAPGVQGVCGAFPSLREPKPEPPSVRCREPAWAANRMWLSHSPSSFLWRHVVGVRLAIDETRRTLLGRPIWFPFLPEADTNYDEECALGSGS